MNLLVEYSWPGDVPELQSTLKQAVLQATGPVLLPEFLPVELRAGHWTAGLADGRRQFNEPVF